MFYLLKKLLYLNLVILKLKCNNLILNKILVLYALYVCLLYSRFIENHPIWILEDGSLNSEVVLSQSLPGRIFLALATEVAHIGQTGRRYQWPLEL
jgi:hypothetical protein